MKNALLAIISLVLCACSNGQEQNSFRIIDNIPLGYPINSFGNWLSENDFKTSNHYNKSLYFEDDFNFRTNKLYKVNYTSITEVKGLSKNIEGTQYSGAILPDIYKGDSLVGSIYVFLYFKSPAHWVLNNGTISDLVTETGEYKYEPTINERYTEEVKKYLSDIYGQPKIGSSNVVAKMVGTELQYSDIPAGKKAVVNSWETKYFTIAFIEGYKSSLNFYNPNTHGYIIRQEKGPVEKGFVPANDHAFIVFHLTTEGRTKLGLNPIPQL